jgi:hypothetical protein
LNTTTTQISTHHPKKRKLDELTLPKDPTCILDIETCEKLWAYSEHLDLERDPKIVDSRDLAYRMALSNSCPVVPQCELGLRQEIVLFYWPGILSKDVCALNGYGTVQTLTSRPTSFSNTPITVITTAITFRGQELFGPAENTQHALWRIKNGVVGTSVLNGNFTFTYPTIYLAHHAITSAVKRFYHQTFDWEDYSETTIPAIQSLQTNRPAFSLQVVLSAAGILPISKEEEME